MISQKPYHLVFNWKEVYISETLAQTVVFLWDIEKEVKQFLSYPWKISSIGTKLLIIIDDLKWLSELIQENNIHYKYNITEETMKIVDEIEKISLPRSQIICLFAYMETIFCLLTVFSHKLENEQEIIVQSNRDLQKFINKYILTNNNAFYKKHKDKLKHIKAIDILELRNKLTHFYSVWDKIGLVSDWPVEQIKKMEELLLGNWYRYIFITPNELFELLRNSVINIFIERTNLTLHQPNEFKERIIFVEKIVQRKSAEMVKINQIAN